MVNDTPNPPTNHCIPKSSGFTLIELLMVVAIIAILSAILIPAVAKVRQSAGNAKCTANLRSLAQATLLYANGHQSLAPVAGGRGALLPNHNQIRPDYTHPPATEAVASYILDRPANLDVVSQNDNETQVSVCFCPHGDQTLDAAGEVENTTASRRYGFIGLSSIAGESPAKIRRTFGDGEEGNYIRIPNLPSPSLTFMWMDWPSASVTHKQVEAHLDRVKERHGGMVNVAYFDGSVTSWTLEDLKATASPSHPKFDQHWRGL